MTETASTEPKAMPPKSNVVAIRKFPDCEMEALDLKTAEVRVNPIVVAMLEELLLSAKRGEIHALIGVKAPPKNSDFYPAKFWVGLSKEWTNIYEITAASLNLTNMLERTISNSYNQEDE